jgi:hypothetical protein
MARDDFTELRRVFENRNWSFIEPQPGATLVSRFNDSHGPVVLVLRFPTPGELTVTAHGIGAVSHDEMRGIMATLGAPPEGPTWGRDPQDNEVWAEWRVWPPADAGFEFMVVSAIDQLMLLIDAWRTRRIELARGPAPSTAPGHPIVALPARDEAALFRFVRTDSLAEARTLLETHPGLLTDVADDKLRRMIADQLSEPARIRVAERRALLKRARTLGLDDAFPE